MAMSGIKVDPAVVDLYSEMKLKAKYSAATFKISEDGKLIVIDKTLDPVASGESTEEPFLELMSTLQEKEPRYVLFDFRFVSKEGRIINKLAFLFWCLDTSPIKKKMVYAASKDAIKKSFSGLTTEFQVNDTAGVDWKSVREQIEQQVTK